MSQEEWKVAYYQVSCWAVGASGSSQRALPNSVQTGPKMTLPKMVLEIMAYLVAPDVGGTSTIDLYRGRKLGHPGSCARMY